ncbi:MAG TPA: hypothetical protein VF665_02515 [Longimicrobium sp.]|jgi:hypothetical protein|uniref:hypothetical protein n=1 Tax=Longimicrobium sp. TaxID=2029185 RepID=UPI002EDA7A4A
MKHLRLALVAALAASMLGTAACAGNGGGRRISADDYRRIINSRGRGETSAPRDHRGKDKDKVRHDNGRRGNGNGNHGNGNGNNGNGRGNGRGHGNGHN